jgi:transcriptional regulator with XRE-family HTH domain
MTVKEVAEKAIKEAGGTNAAARRLGLFSGQSVSQWVYGHNLPGEDIERALAELAGVDPDEFSALLKTIRTARAERRRARKPLAKAPDVPRYNKRPRSRAAGLAFATA